MTTKPPRALPEREIVAFYALKMSIVDLAAKYRTGQRQIGAVLRRHGVVIRASAAAMSKMRAAKARLERKARERR